MHRHHLHYSGILRRHKVKPLAYLNDVLRHLPGIGYGRQAVFS